jgi:prolipoprotein diacylglyceryltransferase
VIARHPTQIYEFLHEVAVFGLMVLADRIAGKEKRPVGLISGVFGISYFAGRFVIEFTKEYLVLDSTSVLTMGQILSIPFFVIGVFLFVRALLELNRNRPAA